MRNKKIVYTKENGPNVPGEQVHLSCMESCRLLLSYTHRDQKYNTAVDSIFLSWKRRISMLDWRREKLYEYLL